MIRFFEKNLERPGLGTGTAIPSDASWRDHNKSKLLPDSFQIAGSTLSQID